MSKRLISAGTNLFVLLSVQVPSAPRTLCSRCRQQEMVAHAAGLAFQQSGRHERQNFRFGLQLLCWLLLGLGFAALWNRDALCLRYGLSPTVAPPNPAPDPSMPDAEQTV